MWHRMSTPDFPVHDSLDVIDGSTVYKNEEWWKAVVVYESYERRIGVYLWKWRDESDRWVRKQKYVIRDPADWERDREIVDVYLSYLNEDGEIDQQPDHQTSTSDKVEAILEDISDSR